jgi:hypothetical protein
VVLQQGEPKHTVRSRPDHKLRRSGEGLRIDIEAFARHRAPKQHRFGLLSPRIALLEVELMG